VLVLGHDSSAERQPEAPEIEDKGDGAISGAESSSSYADASFMNDLELGCSLSPLPDPASIRSVFPSDVPIGSFEKLGPGDSRRMGYLNHDGGWADAGQGVEVLLSEVKRLGVKVCPGKPVSAVQQSNGKVSGVLCTDGTIYEADLAVIATGSWSPSTFPDLGLHETCLATG
jgi:sarcosine oxidase/L-pipecolate oxidase